MEALQKEKIRRKSSYDKQQTSIKTGFQTKIVKTAIAVGFNRRFTVKKHFIPFGEQKKE
jgi:hypothetical protein